MSASWWYLCLLLCCSRFVRESSQLCEGGTCSAQNNVDQILPSNVLDYQYRLGQQVTGFEAADVVLVVSVTQDTSDYHLWLQISVPYLESHLKSLGVGSEAATPNRYCLVQFGGRGSHHSTKFIKVDNQIFFPALSFYKARRQLHPTGIVADGFQAIDFALKHAPFRNDSSIAKIVLFVANSERVPLSTHSHVTLETTKALLRNNSISFNAIIRADMRVQSTKILGGVPSTQTHEVMGLSSLSKGLAVGANYTYSTISGASTVTASKGNIVRDFTNMTFGTEGLLWSLNLLMQQNTTVIQSFVRAMVQEHGVTGRQEREVCQRCRCEEEEEEEEGGGECLGEEEVCDVPADQQLCSCLANQSPDECGIVIAPTPAVPSTESPTKTPRPNSIVIQVDGSVSTLPGGDVSVNFHSNKNKATYDCILLNNSTLTPPVERCTSPVMMKGVQEGKHTFMVIAKRKGYYGTRKFDFEVTPSNPPKTSELGVVLRELPITKERNMAVEIEVTGGREGVRLLCSVASKKPTACSSPYLFPVDELGEAGVLLVVVATDSKGSVAMATTHLQKPITPTYSSGRVKIFVRSIALPNAFGRIVIHFGTSRPDVVCICRANTSRHSCASTFEADPQVLGAGTHNVTIVCQDQENNVDTKDITMSLPPPPPQVFGPLNCNLSLVGPTPQGMVSAVFGCDRPVLATCQVSGRPATSCDAVIGVYEINSAELASGPHLFILNVQDAFGKTLMKVHQFSIGTAHRKCCPLISTDQSSYTSMLKGGAPYVLLNLRVAAGNCTESEGFSYSIDWGDGNSDTGISHRLSPVVLSKTYNTTTTLSSLPRVEATYCNSPILQTNKCCDTASFPTAAV